MTSRTDAVLCMYSAARSCSALIVCAGPPALIPHDLRMFSFPHVRASSY